MSVETQARRPSPWMRYALAIGLLGTLALLIAHALFYAFLTDDAYISFRYARNLADGYGLVFNPGFERVEGYTNFLWVVLLAVAYTLGFSIENSASFFSLASTVGLWAVVVRFAWKNTSRERLQWIVLPAFLLAITRSVAVWSTSGLETRLFELLVVAGVLHLLGEDEHLESGDRRTWPVAALLLALANLTRPDGLLITLCAFGTIGAIRWRRLATRMPWLALSGGVYAVVVGGHYLFRYFYYGAWLPNTYYAKVGGRLWWDAGLEYLGTFVLEYGIYLWIPFLLAAVARHRRHGSLQVPAVFAAVVLPHALYIASIGGDHFEYRPLDLYFPFAYLLIQHGAMFLARSIRATAAVLAALAVVALAIVDLPYRSHEQFPAHYLPGFPGLVLDEHDRGLDRGQDAEVAEEYLSPERTVVYRIPGLRSIAEAHRRLIRSATRRFVGIRQEEHELFLATAIEEGRGLARLVDEGRIPEDGHIAVDCVGAIPYHSGLRALDRLGLTDAHVARGDFVRPEVMAHGKQASIRYARQQGVDLWAMDAVHLLWDERDPRFAEELALMIIKGHDVHLAHLGEGRFVVAFLPQGEEATRRRLPQMEFLSIRDSGTMLDVARDALRLHPRYASGHAKLGMALSMLDQVDQAVLHYRAAIENRPDDAASRNNLATALAQQGRLEEAALELEQATRLDPGNADLFANLGKILLVLQEPEKARRQFRRALELVPDHADARAGLALVARETALPDESSR